MDSQWNFFLYVRLSVTQEEMGKTKEREKVCSIDTNCNYFMIEFLSGCLIV